MRVGPVTYTEVNAAVTAGTAVDLVTPTSGKKFRLVGYHLALSVAGGIRLEEGASDTLVLRLPTMAAAGDEVGPCTLPEGKLSAAADNKLKVDATASGTVTGWVATTEE